MMTGLLHERELSRKSFLKGGGALIVGFSVAGAGLAAKAQAADPAPVSANGSNSPSAGAPDPNSVDSWIAIHSDNTCSLLSGKCEVGTGSSTSLLQIVGEELDMKMSQLKFVTSDTGVTPNTGSTGASNSISATGMTVRAAAATAKKALLDLASASLGVSAASLTVAGGVVSGNGKSVKYGDLIGDKLFNIQMPASYQLTPANVAARKQVGLVNGQAPAKPVSQYTLVGTRVLRNDIPDKITGNYTYVHNVRVPGMLHGRVVLPRGQSAYGVTVPVISVDESSVKHIPNVQVVRKGNFVGVVAAHEYDAIQAAAQLKVKWGDPPALPSNGNLFKQMRDQDAKGQTINRALVDTGDLAAGFAAAAKTVSQTYSTQYVAHSVIGPSCCIADVKANGAVFLSSSKNPYDSQNTLSVLLGLPPTSIRFKYFEGASAFGWPPFNDAAEAAALMSQAVGKPVRVQFMRWDEQGWDNHTPAQLMDIRGGIDAKGNLVAYDFTTFSIPFYNYGVGDTVMQMAGTPLPTPGLGNAETGATGAQYNLANRRVTAKSLPLVGNYLKVSYLRGVLRPASTFGSEQLIDELAHAAGMDPLAFRMQNLTTTDTYRWAAVLNAVAQAANWQPRLAASNLSDANVVQGRGVAVAPSAGSLVANLAEIEVNKKTGKIVAKHVYVAIDPGLAVNPAFVENQISGGLIMGTSIALNEEVRFNTGRTTSLDWVSYPILRFKDHPKVTTIVVQRPELQAAGVGEEGQASIGAAIANAFFDATGVRIREAPMTPARVRAALKAAGVA
jgi:CO/xanthine dehydrogenase Mo-binding subunit